MVAETTNTLYVFVCFLSAEVTANMSASEETLSWLLDIVESDPDPYIRSV